MTDMDIDARDRKALGDEELTGTDDPEVEALVGDIVETREEMTVTVEEIGDRLDPRNIVAGAKDTVREATIGKVEDMANTAGAMISDAGDTVREAGSGIVDTITKNPIPAAMVGLGLGWLALSSRSSSKSHEKASWRYSDRAWSTGDPTYRSGDYSTGVGVMDQDDRSAMDKVGERAGDIKGQVTRTVDDVTDQVGRIADDVPYRVRTTADQIGEEAGRLFEANPLAVGAIAVGVGAAIGMAMPATEMERRAISRPAHQVIARAEEVATDALEGVEESAREVEQTAREEDQKTRTRGTRSKSS